MTIALLYGGKSGEHEISLISATAIARNIDTSEHQLKLIGITKEGRWYLQDYGELARIKRDQKTTLQIHEDAAMEVSVVPAGGKKGAFKVGANHIPVDVVIPAMHGTFSEDGTVQGLLEMADVPYVGCGVMASAVAMDKEKTKVILEHAGIPVVPYICIRRSDLASSARYDELLEEAQSKLGFPLFVKPCSAGSSDGVSRAEDLRHLNGAIVEAFEWDDKILIEKAINARELECSVTGNPTTASGSHKIEETVVYGPGEIAPSHEFYDYDAKYNDPKGAKLLIPAKVDEVEKETIRNLAAQAYKAIDASGLSRVDFFVDKENGDIYLNEINTLPGFTSISMFPKLCESEGLAFDELIDMLIKQAQFRFKATRNLRTDR
ncbi:MAG: D-alanine--D-alanine ligase [Treponema sp.]|nr:D-alanine--D-alanine ligase [Treponema sp.]